MKKYELTEETVTVHGKTLHRIKAVRGFESVQAGELGGYIEKEENLSHSDNAWVSGNAWVCDNAKVTGNAEVSGNAWVYDNAKVFGNAWVYGDVSVTGDAEVTGNAKVSGNAEISSNAEISNMRHFFVQGPIGSRNGFVTFYRTKSNTIDVICGCFSGSLQEFTDKVKKTHEGNKYGKEYKLAVELAKVCIELK